MRERERKRANCLINTRRQTFLIRLQEQSIYQKELKELSRSGSRSFLQWLSQEILSGDDLRDYSTPNTNIQWASERMTLIVSFSIEFHVYVQELKT